MRRVAKQSFEKGKITLVIPSAYRQIAETIDMKAREYGKSFSTLLWELVAEHLKEREELPLPSFNSKGTVFRRAGFYEELLDRKMK